MSKLSRQFKRSFVWINKKSSRTYQLHELWWAAQDTLIYSWWNPLMVWWESICRIVGWLPVLWKDRDWVDNYIFMILEYRLKRARDSMIKYSYYANADKYGQQMRVAELLLKRLQTPHDYVQVDWNEHFNKYGRAWDNCIKNADGSITLRRSSEVESKEIKRIAEKEEYMWQQDFNYLTKHMRKYVRNWGH